MIQQMAVVLAAEEWSTATVVFFNIYVLSYPCPSITASSSSSSRLSSSNSCSSSSSCRDNSVCSCSCCCWVGLLKKKQHADSLYSVSGVTSKCPSKYFCLTSTWNALSTFFKTLSPSNCFIKHPLRLEVDFFSLVLFSSVILCKYVLWFLSPVGASIQ